MLPAIRHGVSLLVAVVALLDGTPSATQAQGSLVLSHASLVDVARGTIRPKTTVVIRGDVIAAVRPSADVVDGPVRRIDASGTFLIPGLWDSHVHTAHEQFLEAYLDAGITGIRDMGMNLELLTRWRNEIRSGSRRGPQMVVAGPLVDGPRSVIPQLSIDVQNVSEVPGVVDRLRRGGSDVLKVYNFLSKPVYSALVRHARQAGLPVAGHVPIAVTAAEASAAGQATIEHLSGVLLGCSAAEEALRRGLAERIAAAGYSPTAVNRELFSAPSPRLLATFNPRRAEALLRTFARNRTRQTPTLVVLQRITRGPEAYRSDPRVALMPSSIADEWTRARSNRQTAEEDAARLKQFHKELELVGLMQRFGVPILAGTDTPNPYVFPGSSLHEELELLVEAGLRPIEALQAATIAPLDLFRPSPIRDRIAPGQIADLVVLDANPLETISNVRRISLVIVRGRLHTPRDRGQPR